ncbi:dephospho-CoA kinase [Lysobacter sp. H23M47]|uniref:dephospho-CoA kinase n=1 Tax=Lysobacter sp. H23M47 TaxID=2781024 RepID=UPI00187F431A|nr:dephospho-CoA kinase [Lysobacter sp. H23M47]QOW24037.1 dephospho-CoA kinase [Lysobacter sp. H23M47]
MSNYIIGVTGGVAAGKSEVTRRFEALGVVVADADVAAREAVARGSDGLAELVDTFGAGILTADGDLDRAAMRERVFTDTDERKRLEAIVHPRIRTKVRAMCEQADGAYAIAAVPLLAEGGGRTAYPWLGRILVVDVPVAVQHARLMQRDGVDAALADAMIAAQATRAQRLAIADDIIVNDGGLDTLDGHIAALDRSFRALAAAVAA